MQPMTMTVTPEMIRMVREALGQSQSQFGETLWTAIHGPRRNGQLPYSRGYISKLERGKKEITPQIARGVLAIVARLDGADEVQAWAREAEGLLAVHELPPGTVVLGQARRCALPGCPVVFVPTHPRQKYHSRECARSARQLRKRTGQLSRRSQKL